MKHRYSFFWLLLFVPFLSNGQSISLRETFTAFRCTGSVMSVSFVTSGTFAADNLFRVQVSTGNNNTFVDLPGTFTSSPASVTLPAPPFPDNFYTYRVVADKPLIISSTSNSFKIGARPTAQLTGSSAGSLPVNPNTPTSLRIALTGGASYSLTMQDSTQLVRTYDYQSDNDFLVAPARTTTYTVARVQNACGTGTASGSATVSVNSVGFRLLSQYSSSFCLGTDLPVYFSNDGPLPANTVFEAELTSTNDGNRSVVLPVVGSESPLRVRLPTAYLGSSSSGYALRIYSKNAGVSALFDNRGTFTLNAPPRFSLAAFPAVVPIGGQATVVLNYTATSPGEVTLTDGRQLSFFSTGSNGSANQITETITASTSYSIASFSGSCAEGATFASPPVTVQVRPGLRLDSLSASEICVGLPITLFFTPTPGYTLPPQVRVRYGNEYFTTDATLVRPGQLVFTPPASSTPGQTQTIQVRHAQTDTLIAQASLSLSVRSKPSVFWLMSERTVFNPGESSLETRVVGGGTTTLTLNTGDRFTVSGGGNSNPFYLPVYLTKTTTYSVVSAANECGAGAANSPALTVRLVSNQVFPTGVSISSASSSTYNRCPGSREWINVFLSGTFNADNQFQLEMLGPNGEYSSTPIPSFSGTAPVSFLLPTYLLPTSGSLRVWVSSTSPVTRSNNQFYGVSGAPLAMVNINFNSTAASLTIAAGQRLYPYYVIQNGRSPFRYELANGVKGQTETGFQTTDQPARTTTYGIRVTDACGATATAAASVVVVPSLLRTGTVGAWDVCVQSPVAVPFTQLGTIPASVSYVVQFSDDLLTWQTAPTTGTASPLMARVPAAFVNKRVYYRVAYLANGVLVPGLRTDNQLLQVGTTPNVLLSTPNNATTVQVDRVNGGRLN